MKGFLKQFTTDDGDPLALFYMTEDIPENVLIKAYKEWDNSDESTEIDFDDWWNNQNRSQSKLERVFVDEITI